MSHLTIVDVSPLRDPSQTNCDGVAQELGERLHKIGFVGIQGHGIAPSLIREVREQVMMFFALPLEQKMALLVQQNDYRGYIPLGFFTPNAAHQDADQYEGYKLHFETPKDDSIRAACDLYGANRWPPDMPLLRQKILDYWAQCDALSKLILRALELNLGLRSGALTDAFDKPLTNMTLLHYPPADAARHGYGIHPHKDTDALTILAPDDVGGLWVRPRHYEQWIDASVPDDTLLVNVGDMLETWSSGYFQSTPHKVVNTSGRERFSFPYFAVPRHDVPIEPMNASLELARPGAESAGEISRKIWHSNWPDAAPIEDKYDPYTQ